MKNTSISTDQYLLVTYGGFESLLREKLSKIPKKKGFYTVFVEGKGKQASLKHESIHREVSFYDISYQEMKVIILEINISMNAPELGVKFFAPQFEIFVNRNNTPEFFWNEFSVMVDNQPLQDVLYGLNPMWYDYHAGVRFYTNPKKPNEGDLFIGLTHSSMYENWLSIANKVFAQLCVNWELATPNDNCSSKESSIVESMVRHSKEWRFFENGKFVPFFE